MKMNKEVYKQAQPNKAPTGTNGYPEKNVKKTGIKQRGSGAATKGFTSRGPMA